MNCMFSSKFVTGKDWCRKLQSSKKNRKPLFFFNASMALRDVKGMMGLMIVLALSR
jgi:hypothetical protein